MGSFTSDVTNLNRLNLFYFFIYTNMAVFLFWGLN